MASLEEQERHYIGDLLSEDEVFTQSNRPRETSVGHVPTASVLAGTAAVGPSPNQAFWPEPPPPYSAAAPHWASLHQPGSGNTNSAQFYPQSPFNTLKQSTHEQLPWGTMYTPFGSRPAPPPQKMQQQSLSDLEQLNNSTGTYSPLLPIGKSYRDVASNKNSIAGNGPLVKNIVISPQILKKKSPQSTAASPINLHQQRHSSSGDSAEQPLITKLSTMVINDTKQPLKNSMGKKDENQSDALPPTSNEFQKITRKKGRQQRLQRQRTDPTSMTLSPTEALTINVNGPSDVGAQSRFDILDSQGKRNGNSHRPVTPTKSSPVSSTTTNSTNRSSTAVLTRSLTGEEDDEEDSQDENDDDHKSTGGGHRLRKLRSLGISAHNDGGIASRGGIGTASIKRAAATGGGGARRLMRQDSDDAAVIMLRYINVFMVAVFSMLERSGRWIFDLIADILLQLGDIILYASRATYTNVLIGCQRIRRRTHEKYRSFISSFRKCNWMFWRRYEQNGSPTEWGLSNNIQLPSTGEEAMQRLLRCRGQDAYSILGLRYSCTDDEIKHFYRRQAVLVHPDKNLAQGADEAFKILARAFELIGTKEARCNYNLENIHKDPLHRELEELWERLREKMTEAMNTMHCDCGNKHRRFPTEMRPAEARFCRRCETRHPARQNDIWAETRFFGLIWYYYACMDGAVYDITQWASCPKNRLKHMKANSHTVQYRLISSAGTTQTPPAAPGGGGRGTSSGGGQQRQNNNASTADVDDLLTEYLDNYRSGGDRTLPGNSSSSSARGVNHGGLEASYRPPERRLLDDSRPRRAGRRRRPPVGK